MVLRSSGGSLLATKDPFNGHCFYIIEWAFCEGKIWGIALISQERYWVSHFSCVQNNIGILILVAYVFLQHKYALRSCLKYCSRIKTWHHFIWLRNWLWPHRFCRFLGYRSIWSGLTVEIAVSYNRLAAIVRAFFRRIKEFLVLIVSGVVVLWELNLKIRNPRKFTVDVSFLSNNRAVWHTSTFDFILFIRIELPFRN